LAADDHDQEVAVPDGFVADGRFEQMTMLRNPRLQIDRRKVARLGPPFEVDEAIM